MFHITIGETKPRRPALVLRSEPFIEREHAVRALERLKSRFGRDFVGDVFVHHFPHGHYDVEQPIPNWAIELRDFG